MNWPVQELWRVPVSDWPPAWASAWGSDRYGLWAELVVGPATQRMRWIEPSGPEGFSMGEVDHQRQVVVNAGFWLADTPCTQAFWVAVADDRHNPSMFRHGPDAAQCPVEQVSWDDVQTWFGQFALQCSTTAGLAFLPAELEWEYAARAGTSSNYWWGNEFDDAKANADGIGNKPSDGSKGATTPVKRYPPNPWGLYDVHGNVWEWCDDAWLERLDGEGGEAVTYRRTVRGGSWITRPGSARAACRVGRRRGGRDRSRGFRLSLRSPGPGAKAFAVR